MKLKIMKKLCMVVGMLVVCSMAGTLKDSRDGKTYKTVKIGKQVWMAENLNVNVPGSMCFNDDPANCERYGRLYTWEAAKSACPAGWHLPSNEEFKTLLATVRTSGENQSKNLRAGSWENGANKFGFSALPAGRYDSESFDRLGNDANFWSSEGRSGYNSLIFSKSGGLGDRKRAKRDFDDNIGCGGGLGDLIGDLIGTRRDCNHGADVDTSQFHGRVGFEYNDSEYGFSVRCLRY